MSNLIFLSVLKIRRTKPYKIMKQLMNKRVVKQVNPVFEMQMCGSNITNWLLSADGIFPQKDRPSPAEHFKIKQGQACVVCVICPLIDVSGKSKWGQIPTVPICSDGLENWSVQTIFYPGRTDKSRLLGMQKMA